jgi:hypothetical protein
VSVTYTDGNTINGMTQVNFCVAGGDSGGPVLSNYYLYGLVSGGGGTLGAGNCVAYYDDAPQIQQEHGVTFATQG